MHVHVTQVSRYVAFPFVLRIIKPPLQCSFFRFSQLESLVKSALVFNVPHTHDVTLSYRAIPRVPTQVSYF